MGCQVAFCQVEKDHLIVYYTMRAIQSRGFPPNLFSCIIGVWPSGKAGVFGSIHRSHPDELVVMIYTPRVSSRLRSLRYPLNAHHQEIDRKSTRLNSSHT